MPECGRNHQRVPVSCRQVPEPSSNYLNRPENASVANDHDVITTSQTSRLEHTHTQFERSDDEN